MLSVNRYIFALISILLTGIRLPAQSIFPLGGYISSEKIIPIGSSPFYRITAHISFSKYEDVPEYISFEFGDGSPQDSAMNSIFIINCDSTVSTEYTIDHYYAATEGTYVVETALDSNYKWIDDNSRFTIRSSIHVSGMPYRLNPIPEFYFRKLYHNPSETFRGNIFQHKNAADSLYFVPTPELGWDNATGNHINPATGDFVLNDNLESGNNGLSILVKHCDSFSTTISQNQVQLTVVVDSTLNSSFVYNNAYENDKGFIVLKTTKNSLQTFQFSFVDPDADSVVPSVFFDEGKLGTAPVITYTQSGDTLHVSTQVLISDSIYNRLPASLSFIFNSVKAGEKCINRCFSFYLDKTPPTGIAEMNGDKNTIHIYPNPVDDNLFIDLPATVSYKLFNANGQLIQDGKTEKIIPVQMLSSGLYLLYVTDETGQPAGQLKFVKN